MVMWDCHVIVTSEDVTAGGFSITPKLFQGQTFKLQVPLDGRLDSPRNLRAYSYCRERFDFWKITMVVSSLVSQPAEYWNKYRRKSPSFNMPLQHIFLPAQGIQSQHLGI